MKKFVVSLLLLCCWIVTRAGAGQIFEYGRYAPGTVVSVFSEGANLRAFPSTTAPVMTRVAIGTPVLIREQDSATHASGGYTEPWYRVRCPLRDGTVMFGYMWGGALAKAATTVPYRGTDALLLAGITGTGPDHGERIFAARVVSGGKIVAQTGFPNLETPIDDNSGMFHYTMDAERIDTAGFSPALTVIRIGFIYEACDFANGDVLLLWNGSRLSYGIKAVRSRNELAALNYTLVFPGDSGGREKTILVHYVAQECSDTGPPRQINDYLEPWLLDRENSSFQEQ